MRLVPFRTGPQTVPSGHGRSRRGPAAGPSVPGPHAAGAGTSPGTPPDPGAASRRPTVPRPRRAAKPRRGHGTGAAAGLAAMTGLLLLAGCDADPNRFPPACPAASLLADAADLTRFDGRGQDLTDMVADGKITGLAGRCREAADGRTLVATVTVSLDLSRGPAARGRTEPVGYFVAVTKGEQILDKRVFELRVAFPPNTDLVHVSGEPIRLDLPTPAGTTGASYRILVGFQLTPEQLALNRRRGMR